MKHSNSHKNICWNANSLSLKDCALNQIAFQFMANLSYMIKSILIVRSMFFKINLWLMCLKMFKQWWYKFKYVIVHTYGEIKVHIHYFACGFLNIIVHYKVHIKLTIYYCFSLLKDFMFSHNLVLFVIFNKN
jgi:hypothetical protein